MSLHVHSSSQAKNNLTPPSHREPYISFGLGVFSSLSSQFC